MGNFVAINTNDLATHIPTCDQHVINMCNII